MDILQAFSTFKDLLQERDEGLFFAEQKASGEVFWVFGVGEVQAADFERGPFPFFSATSFLGDQHACWYFPQWYASDHSSPELEAKVLKEQRPRPAPQSRRGEVEDGSSYSDETKASFCEKIRAVQDFEKNGEAWVVNLAHELSGDQEVCVLEAFSMFLNLKKPFCGGVCFTKEQKFCSFSPEVFLRQKGTEIFTYPIKGTGPQHSLEESKKEIAELTMITDLLRNDLGQICTEVELLRQRVITDQQDFFHAHSVVRGELPDPVLKWQQYQKLLPAGSVSGAPKKRVVEKILELEEFDRGFYTGTFGVKMSRERALFNILIRTLFQEKNHWRFPVGAGITVDSDPAKEWEETLLKAADFYRVFLCPA